MIDPSWNANITEGQMGADFHIPEPTHTHSVNGGTQSR